MSVVLYCLRIKVDIKCYSISINILIAIFI